MEIKEGGFTLIEILIAVAIIAVLTAVTLSSAAALQKNSRDARRTADLSSLQVSLQQYYADQNYYPLAGLSAGALNLQGGSFASPNGSIVYLNKIPTDPLGLTSPYVYVPLDSEGTIGCDNSVVTCVKYCLYAKLEFQKPATVEACDIKPPKPNPLPLPLGEYDYEVSQP